MIFPEQSHDISVWPAIGRAMKGKKRKTKAKAAPVPNDIFDPNSTHRRPFVRLDGTIEWPRDGLRPRRLRGGRRILTVNSGRNPPRHTLGTICRWQCQNRNFSVCGVAWKTLKSRHFPATVGRNREQVLYLTVTPMAHTSGLNIPVAKAAASQGPPSKGAFGIFAG